MFNWECQPGAEALCLRLLDRCIECNSYVAQLEKDLLEKTSTRLFDWVDHFTTPLTIEIEKELEYCGFTEEDARADYRIFSHPGAQLPSIQVYDQKEKGSGIALNVDSISTFLMVHRKTCFIEGAPNSGYRRSLVHTENGVDLYIVERRGSRSFDPTYPEGDANCLYTKAKELWQTRPREDDSIEEILNLAEQLVNKVGCDRAAWIVLECEREYWQAKNRAGQMQKNRQDQLGMGWANHDHHTFRSSRLNFSQLVGLFEILGFYCRERFYAGQEAGWGAQVMENPNCGLVLFLDVDLAPEELKIDFAHQQLPKREKLGTVGLWCALHGDSILQAGMHHLEAQFVFDSLKQDLKKLGIGMMAPFSDFPFLKQAFTTGEKWFVDPKRIENLLQKRFISEEDAKHFLNEGAIGSHLENLQRKEGYKGFNQHNVSTIIRKTDPRKIHL